MAPRKRQPLMRAYAARPEPEGVWDDCGIILGRFKLIVTSEHVAAPKTWTVSCSPFFDLKVIGKASDMTEEQARIIALTMVKEELDRALKAVDEAIG